MQVFPGVALELKAARTAQGLRWTWRNHGKKGPSEFTPNFTSPRSPQGFLATGSVTEKEGAALEQLSPAPPSARGAAPAGSEAAPCSLGHIWENGARKHRAA